MISCLKVKWCNSRNLVNFTRFFKIMTENSFNFIQHLNPVSNEMEWKVVYDDYDYNQEIATSCYGDMLHDDERNKKFGLALEKAIKLMHEKGKKAHVLDIGTGTGLLSMLAVRYGADSVVACEAFLPMANCAFEIIRENSCAGKIKLVKKHSTSLTVGEDGDLKQKANILVSEVFDTELIGEGAIKTFNHAHEYLLEEDCIVIPSSGSIYAQVVESDLAQKWNQLKDWKDNENILVKIPEEIKNCPGAAAVHDIQLSQFPQQHFKALSPVTKVFEFDWSGKKPIQTHRQAEFQTKAISSGKAQVVFMWWDLMMDTEGEITLSCAPVWEHPDIKDKKVTDECTGNPAINIPWRDHWMQAVYFLTKENRLSIGEPFTLIASHDEFSFWFQISNTAEERQSLRPVCTCSFHFLLSRTRIGAMNDDRRRNVYINSLKKIIDNNSVCFVLGDMSLLSILVAKLGARKVFVLQDNLITCKVLNRLSNLNQVDEIITICTETSQITDKLSDFQPDKVIILSEPFFRNAILPWDNISFWYLKNELTCKNVKTVPYRCKLRACAVRFDDLWKISTSLKTREGFDMKTFDELIENAKDKAESYTEPQPLWEYPGIALTLPVTLFDFRFDENLPSDNVKNEGEFEFGLRSRCDGVALWTEYELAEDCFVQSGPIKEIVIGEYISWDMFERQGVRLFRNGPDVNKGDLLYYEVEFKSDSGEFSFNFSFGS